MENPSRERSLSAEVREERDGLVRLVLRGRLDLHNTGRCWRELEQRLGAVTASRLVVDAGQAEFSGAIGVALLRYLSEGGMTHGAKATIEGLKPELQKLLEVFTGEDYRAYEQRKPERASVPEEIGAGVRGLVADLRDQVIFIGSLVTALPSALAHPRQMRWSEVRRVVETAGANALPVVGLFSFLVGLVLALESVKPLAQFGAQIFVANMIGFSTIRDTGPLVTAVMLAGRSGSAFAAELGTMKVNEELDALATMGLDPVRFLVIQRVVGALMLTPLLTLYAMLLGIVGGVMVMRLQGYPPLMIFHQIIEQVALGDLMVGLAKAVIFGLIVGGVGCLRGLQTREGPQAVGVSATRSVVACIILVIVADTIFSTAQYVLS